VEPHLGKSRDEALRDINQIPPARTAMMRTAIQIKPDIISHLLILE
jgi:hypothetical protein